MGKLRVLMVSEDVPAPQVGGLGKHAVTLANALLRDGHSVSFMGRSDIDYATHREEMGWQGVFIPGFHLRRNGWKETSLGVWMPFKRTVLARRIASAILRVASRFDVVHYHGHLALVGTFIPPSINFVQTRHDQGSECITHLRFRRGAICGATSAVECASCIHDAPGPLRSLVSAYAVEQYRAKARLSFERHKTIFVSEFLLRRFLLQVPLMSPIRSWVIHNFVDFARLRRAVFDGSSLGTVGLLMVGRIDTAKGFGAFLEAYARVSRPVPRVTIIGDGPERVSLEQRYASDEVRFMGWRSFEFVARATYDATACVMPSIWQEPFGSTTLEALVMGRACFALREGGTPELKAYERYKGQLTLADSVHDLAAQAARYANEPYSRVELDETSQADVSVAVARIVSVYEAA